MPAATNTRFVLLAFALSIAAMGVRPVLAGPLTPPAGPVASTGKTLDQIEPRRVINDLPGDATAVHIISAPGSYYLTGNIAGQPGKHGIDVRLPSGTNGPLVINGEEFVLKGAVGALTGINIVSTDGTQIDTQGRVRACAIAGPWGEGVRVEYLAGIELTGLTITNTVNDGIVVADCDSLILTNSTMRGSGGAACRYDRGIQAVVDRVIIINPTGDGLVVEGAIMNSTKRLSVRNVTVHGAGGTACRFDRAVQAVVDGVSIHDPTGDGLVIENCGDVSVSNVSVSNAGQNAYRWWVNKKMKEAECTAIAPGLAGLDVRDADVLTLNGLTVIDAGTDACRVLRVASFGVSEEGVKITAPTGNGLYVEDCTAVALTNVVVTDPGGDGLQMLTLPGVGNATYDIRVSKVTGAVGNGLIVDSADAVNLDRVTVTGSGFDGVRVTNTNALNTAGVRAVSNLRHGLSVETVAVFVGHADSVQRNGMLGSFGGGIVASDVASVSLSETTIGSNVGDGLLVTIAAGAPPSVTCNELVIKDNTGRGAHIVTGTGSITDCNLVGNTDFAIETGVAFSGSITSNRCHGNGGAILVEGFGCCVTSNIATAGVLGFISVPAPGNVVGPLVEELSVGSSCSPFANILY